VFNGRFNLLTVFFSGLLVAAFVSGASPSAAQGQPGTSSIDGVVRDSSGAAIPGAVIRLSQGDAANIEVVTDEQGIYRVTNLAPGQYRVETTLDGFEPVVQIVALAPANPWTPMSRCGPRGSPRAWL
jgi:hypothetical protein